MVDNEGERTEGLILRVFGGERRPGEQRDGKHGQHERRTQRHDTSNEAASEPSPPQAPASPTRTHPSSRRSGKTDQVRFAQSELTCEDQKIRGGGETWPLQRRFIDATQWMMPQLIADA